jgi:DNA-binding transcriptional LysR family regulator
MMDARLNHVVFVARTGSFTAAAEAIGVTQSAVTKGVADLERQLGYALFYRTGRGALLTEKGRNFAERAGRLLDDARTLLTGEDMEDGFGGILRIGVCPASLEWRLTEPITQLKLAHPELKFEISGSSFERMVQLLRNGGVDVVLGFDAAFGEWAEFQREPVSELSSRLFVRNEHPILKMQPITLDQIAKYELASPSDSRPYGAVIRELFESHNIDWRKRLHVIDYFPLVRNIVATSDAVGVVALSHAETQSFQSRFTTLDVPGMFAPAPICCATRARWEPSPAVKAFIRAVRSDSTAI